MRENEVKKHHLEELFAYLETNTKRFSETLEIDPTRIYNILHGKNKVSSSLAKLITSKYKDVNFEWLRTGKEPMLKNNRQKSENTNCSGVVGNISGKDLNINDSTIISGLIRTIEKRDEQMDRLISIIEQLNKR